MASGQSKNSLPRSSYAYAPSSDPTTWKLPFRTASGAPDPNHLPGASAALSSGGFRGQKVAIPSTAVSMVKAKLRRAHKELYGADASLPDSLKEGDPMKESVVLLDRATDSGQVAVCPSCGDTLVIPLYNGQYDDIKNPAPAEPAMPTSNPVWDISDALGALRTLISLKATEAGEGEAADTATIQTAIDALMKFIGSETSEITPGMCLACDHDMGCDCADCACDSSVHIDMAAEGGTEQVAEAGRRNSKRDEMVLKSIVELVKQLGVATESPAAEPTVEPDAPVTEGSVAESVVIGSDTVIEDVTFTESGSMGAYVSLREADAIFDESKREIIITPIRPGWGNAKDGYYYTESALKEAVENGVFNQKPVKMYANHPSRRAEEALPERSVWDWVSTMRETWWDAEKNRPQSRIKVYDDRFWDRAKRAPDEIAFSILGGGKSRRGRVGNREARIVESLSQIRSVDWVTEAGAGGAIEKFAESAHEEFEMDIKNLTAEQLKEAAPELYEAIVAAAKAETPAVATEAPVVESAETETPEVEVAAEEPVVPVIAEPVAEAAPVAEEAPAVNAEIAEMRRELDAVKKALADKELAEAVAQNKQETAAFVADVIKESTLPAIAKNQVAVKFREATAGEGYLYSDQDSLKVAIEQELSERQALIDSLTGGRSTVKGLGAGPKDEGDTSVRESVAKRLEDKWGPAPTPATSASGVADDDDSDDKAIGGAMSEAATALSASMAAKFGI